MAAIFPGAIKLLGVYRWRVKLGPAVRMDHCGAAALRLTSGVTRRMWLMWWKRHVCMYVDTGTWTCSHSTTSEARDGRPPNELIAREPIRACLQGSA